jgi:hypothetical protein
MFMPNINNILYKFNINYFKLPSARATSSKALGERAAGAACGQGILGGSPKNPSGGHSRALVPPEGGVGGRKSGI